MTYVSKISFPFRRLNRIKGFIFCIIIVVILVKVIEYKKIKKTNKNEEWIYIEPEINKSNSICNPFNEIFETKFVNFNGTFYPRSKPHIYRNSINYTCLQMSNKIKKIFLWNTYSGNPTFGFDLGVESAFKLLKCPVTNCEMTNDMSKLNESDLVIVHMGDIINPIPKKRPRFQRWVFYFLESQGNYPNFEQFDGLFNLRSTHQIDSDFPHKNEVDSKMFWIENTTFNESYDYTTGKTGLVAGLISNCNAKSKRLEYIKEMQKYAPVKIFGKCGEPCPDKHAELKSYDCRWKIAKQFKFFLAFENSICQDYITEKFYYTLRHDIVPVVLGGGNYEHYVIIFP